MIRPITSQDKEIFLELTRHFYHSDAVLHPIPEEYHQKTFAELVRTDVYALGYLLEYAGKPAGYALLAKTFSQEAGGYVLWLDELYVLPDYRSKGLGREFFQFLEDTFPETARIRLEVEAENIRAIALYEKMGFISLPYRQMIKDRR